MQIPSSWRMSLGSSAVGASRKGPGAKVTIRASAIARLPRQPKLRRRRAWDTNCDGKVHQQFQPWDRYRVMDSC